MPHSLACWMYISRSLLNAETALEEVQAIVDVAQRRNADMDVTGALIFSNGRFAQKLEGPPTGIDALRQSICRDSRHTAITTIEEGPAPERQFGGWSLAFKGSSQVISRSLERSLDELDTGGRYGHSWLLKAMIDLTTVGMGNSTRAEKATAASHLNI